MQKLTRLASETAIYGLGTIVPRLINYFLVIPHTRIFNAEAYGVITNLYAYAGFLNVIFLFGMETAFFRFASKPGASVDRVFRLAQTIVLAIALPVSGLLLLNAEALAQAWEIPGHAEYIQYLVAIILIDAVVAIPFARWRQEKRALLFSATKIINVLVLVGLNYLFLYFLFDPTIGVGYVLLANLIANALFLLFQFRNVFTWRPAWDRTMSPSMIRYAYPVMLMGVAGMTNELFSRISIQWWWPPNFKGQSAQYALGVFGACYKYAVFMNLVVMAFRYAAEPFFFSQASDKKSPDLFARINHYFVIAGAFIVLAVTINLDLLKFMLGSSEYYEGLDIVAILLVGYLFMGVYYNFSVWFKVTDRTHFGTWFTVGGALLTVVGNYVLIPVAGYYGSAWVTLLSSACMMMACYAFGQRYYPIPYKLIGGLAYLGLALALIFIAQQVSISSQVWATLFHSLLCAFFVGIVYIFERKEFSKEAN
jgi:O-antigen/teichoic acid export membrane protein